MYYFFLRCFHDILVSIISYNKQILFLIFKLANSTYEVLYLVPLHDILWFIPTDSSIYLYACSFFLWFLWFHFILFFVYFFLFFMRSFFSILIVSRLLISFFITSWCCFMIWILFNTNIIRQISIKIVMISYTCYRDFVTLKCLFQTIQTIKFNESDVKNL